MVSSHTKRRPWRKPRARALAPAVLLLVGLLAACSSSSAAAGPSAPSGNVNAKGDHVLKLGIVVEASGAYAPVFAPAAHGAEAAVAAINKAGGVNGYTFSTKVYDSASNPAGGAAAVRAAIADGVFAVISVSQYVDIPLLVQNKIPTFGYGVSPPWYGPNTQNLFSYTGDIVDDTNDGNVESAIAAGRSRIGVISDPDPGGIAGAKTWAKEVRSTPGATLTALDLNLDSSDVAGINAIAQNFINSKTQAILSTSPVGTAALQAAINQLGGNIWCYTASEYGTPIEQQFGQAVDGLVYSSWVATPEHNTPGLAAFKSAMQSAGYSSDINATFAIDGYVSAEVLFKAITAVKGSLTQSSLIQTTNNNFSPGSIGGLITPPNWPAAHTQIAAHWSLSQMKSGKWTAFNGQVFAPGKSFS